MTYDVSDDKRRTKVFELLTDHGDWAQFSVFFCELNAAEVAHLRTRIREEINQREDQILILDLGRSSRPLEGGLQVLGRAYEVPTRTLVV
ncbi:MAG: CRISPR-associated endonuclease Cas2 [Gemmatimonadota bacterium]